MSYKNNAISSDDPKAIEKLTEKLHKCEELQTLIKKASECEEGEQRTALIRLIANNMKKDYVTWNKDLADDNKIFDDLRDMSHGEIDIDSSSMTLTTMRNGNNFYKNNGKNGKNGKKSAKQ